MLVLSLNPLWKLLLFSLCLAKIIKCDSFLLHCCFSNMFYLFSGLLAFHWLSSCSYISNCEYQSFLLIFVFLILLSQSIYFFVIYLTVSVTLIVYFVDLWFAFYFYDVHWVLVWSISIASYWGVLISPIIKW